MTSVERACCATLPDGRAITRWTLRNASGARITLIDIGAAIVTLEAPDRDGRFADVVLGFDDAASYLSQNEYIGAVVGRFANRIAGGRFNLDGRDYALTLNDAPNTLHGGGLGFDRRVWRGEEVTTPEGRGVCFKLTSAEGEEGYPGAVELSVTYIWTAASALIVQYHATTDAATPFNVAQHSYWNLAGVSGDTVLDHELRIHADAYTPVDATLIPTGEIASVANTPFDFRRAKPIGRDIACGHDQLGYGKGFDHNWVLNGTGLRDAAWLYDPRSGRTLTVSTDQPGLQFYSGNFLDGGVVGKGGVAYPFRGALALETQRFPDSPNRPNFPDAILRPGIAFESRTIFQFGVLP